MGSLIYFQLPFMDCYCDLPIPIPIYTTLFSFYTKKSLPSYFLHIKVLYKALFSKFLNGFVPLNLPSLWSSQFLLFRVHRDLFLSITFPSKACTLFTIICTLIVTVWSSVSPFHIRSTITIFFSILHPQHNTSQVKLAFTL